MAIPTETPVDIGAVVTIKTPVGGGTAIPLQDGVGNVTTVAKAMTTQHLQKPFLLLIQFVPPYSLTILPSDANGDLPRKQLQLNLTVGLSSASMGYHT